MFSHAVNFKENTSFQARGLLESGCLERLWMACEPHLQDSIAAYTSIDAPRHGLYFRQFRHVSIVRGNDFNGPADGRRIYPR